jgi:hypothetical protein
VVGADGVRSGLEPTASGACSVGGVSFPGGIEAAASGGGGGISAGGGGGSGRRGGGGSGRRGGGVCFVPAPPAEKTRGDARGVAGLDSTPTLRVLECFVGPFHAKPAHRTAYECFIVSYSGSDFTLGNRPKHEAIHLLRTRPYGQTHACT